MDKMWRWFHVLAILAPLSLLMAKPVPVQAAALEECIGALRLFVWLDIRSDAAPFFLLPHHTVVAVKGNQAIVSVTNGEGTLIELVPCGIYRVRSATSESDVTVVEVDEADVGRYRGLRVVAETSILVYIRR